MPQLDLSFAQDPNTLALALIYGMIPAVLWVFYWLRENRERPRHSGLLTACFFGGAFMVVLALPVEKWIALLSADPTALTVMWASAEELLKFGIFAFIILRSKTAIEEPIDYAIYIMMVALGFAGFENALYFLAPLQAGAAVTLYLSGIMRFLGTTLMHTATASLAGIALGFSYYHTKLRKTLSVAVALLIACTLHSIFNLTIAANDGENFFQIFGVLWIATIGILILLERLRTLSTGEYRKKKIDTAFAGLDAQFAGVLTTADVVATDETPLSVALANKQFAGDGKEAQALRAFLQVLRDFYARYLDEQGGDVDKISTSTAALIPDTISPRAISGVIAALKAGITIAETKTAEEKNDLL